jgi:hypothetical protein
MAGTIGASAREEVRRVEMVVNQDAIDAVLIEVYGTPLPSLTMDEIQTAILNKELNGEFTASVQSGMPTIGETEFIGRISGALEIFHGASDTEIMHWTNFSGAFSGSMDLGAPGNADIYPVLDWGCSNFNYANSPYRHFKGHFKYNKGGASYMSASIGVNGHKTITGSFPSNYYTSSAVTTQDINDLSQSLFSGSFRLSSGSMTHCDFYTCNGSDYRLTNTDGSLFGDKYDRLSANCEVAFSLGDNSSGTTTRHLMLGGNFSNSSSLNATSSQGDNVALITNIVRGDVFTTSGSLSGSLESLSDGLYIDRSPGGRTSGNYYSKSQGTDSNGKPKKKKTVIGAKNRVEVKTKRDELQSKIGTATGRAVTSF